MNGLEEYTQKIEALLQEQREENKKLKRFQLIQSIAFILFVAVFTAGIIAVNSSVTRATAGLPELVATATTAVDSTTKELTDLLEEINKVDFAALAKTLEAAGKSIDSIDVDALNDSIESLNAVVQKMAAFFGIKS